MKPILRLLPLLLALLAGCRRHAELPLDAEGARQCAPIEDGGVPLDCARFRATHNSYSTTVDRSLAAQLDDGVRFLELDVHDEDFRGKGDFEVGHALPGWELRRGGGNPDSDRLGEWLRVVAAWSAAHPGHAPVTVALDLKDDLTDNADASRGDPGALNAQLRAVFGEKLFTPEALEAAGGEWPTVDALRGRILVVLSGDVGTRLDYRRRTAASPAVALAADGRAVAVFEGPHGWLWAWTGHRRADGTFAWTHRARYARGRAPAVAIGAGGEVVVVHASGVDAGLWYRAGRLGPDGIAWAGSGRYDEGDAPTVRFEGPGRLVGLHRDPSGQGNRIVRGTLGAAGVAWSAPLRTWRARHDKATDRVAGRFLRVSVGPDASMPAETLRYSSDAVPDARLRFDQLAFVELQPGDPPELADDGLRHAAAPSGDRAFATDQLAAGRIVRWWGFDDGAVSAGVPVHLPATDRPLARWYRAFADKIRAEE